MKPSSRSGTRLERGAMKIAPDVYQLAIRAANTIIIIEEELTIIDTGLPGSSTRITDFIQSLGRSIDEVSLVIITHNHFDHVGGLAELRKLTGARVAVHRADLDDTGGETLYPGLIRRLLRARPFLKLYPVLVLKSDEVDIHLEGGEVLKPLGGLEVIHTPGHTLGSISLYSSREKLLIVGDALRRWLESPRLPSKTISRDMLQAISSIEKMTALDFDTVCFGHLRPLTGDIRARMQRLIERNKVDNTG